MILEHTILETNREIWMSQEDEKTDQELYRVDPESVKENSAAVVIPIEGATVMASSELEETGAIFSETTISENTPETVVVTFGSGEISDLSGNSGNDVILTASKNLIVK